MKEWLLVDARDNVGIALQNMKSGFRSQGFEFVLSENIESGHKFALRPIACGEKVYKYGYAIGVATKTIRVGEWVHTHNVRTNISEETDVFCEFNKKVPLFAPMPKAEALADKHFMGYVRDDGKVGIRNEFWIIPTVGCINRTAERIANILNEKFAGLINFEGAFALTHPYGCSQLGEDFLDTRSILSRLAEHPNAGGCLILGLGCENNTISGMQAEITRKDNIAFLVAQNVVDEVGTAIDISSSLIWEMCQKGRSRQPLSKLNIGLKCGGSDGLSGITANFLVGKISDTIVAEGGSTVLTETPEMFGAEEMLFRQAADEKVLSEAVKMIKVFKNYFQKHGLPVYENPSPGNKDGGITTLEEKSLGCVQKGGKSSIVDVLSYGEKLKKQGLSLLYGPGNDMVASTALVAAGCQLILFTTGRGTPYGTVVPTMKISSNSMLAFNKPSWIDFDSGGLLNDGNDEKLTQSLLMEMIHILNGKRTKAEINHYKEIAIFKTGITL